MSREERDTRRPVLMSVSGRDEVRVILEYRGREYVGECDARAAGGLHAASATATLQALEELTPPDVRLGLDWCGVLEPGGGVGVAVVVFATLVAAGVRNAHAGVALVHQDVQVAAVRAALDAMNRRLEVMGVLT